MTTYRYRVTAVEGKVPEQITDIVGKKDAYLLYPEYRGDVDCQHFLKDNDIVGSWWMEFAGRKP